MSGRRRAPAWPRAIALALSAGFVALALIFAARLCAGALRMARSGSQGADPQFAEPAETVTRPPELGEEGAAPDQGEDPSASWDLGEQTPVDKTAEELSREAALEP